MYTHGEATKNTKKYEKLCGHPVSPECVVFYTWLSKNQKYLLSLNIKNMDVNFILKTPTTSNAASVPPEGLTQTGLPIVSELAPFPALASLCVSF